MQVRARMAHMPTLPHTSEDVDGIFQRTIADGQAVRDVRRCIQNKNVFVIVVNFPASGDALHL